MLRLFSSAALLGVILGAGFIAGTTTLPVQAKATHASAKKTVYVCSMHPAVVASKPGKCPQCKMALTKKTVSAVYTCPMHPRVLTLKPGKCPICKMTLKKK